MVRFQDVVPENQDWGMPLGTSLFINSQTVLQLFLDICGSHYFICLGKDILKKISKQANHET